MTKKANVTGLADELGIIRAKMADLKVRETEIREVMIEAGISAFEDRKFRAVVVESLRTYIDWKSVADASLDDLHEGGLIGSTEKNDQVVYFPHKPK